MIYIVTQYQFIAIGYDRLEAKEKVLALLREYYAFGMLAVDGTSA